MAFWLDILVAASLQAMAAVGLFIQIRSGQFNVGAAVFIGIGGYTSGVLSATFGVPLVVSIAAAILFGFLAGALFSSLTLRLHHWFFAVTTLALSIAAQNSVGRIPLLGGPNGLAGIPILDSAPLILSLLVLVTLGVFLLDRSAIGLAIRATGDDEQLSRVFGVKVKRLRIFVFALGSAIGALSGALTAHRFGVYQPSDLGSEHSLLLLVYVIVGGKRSLWGPLLGAGVLYLLPEVIEFPPQARLIIFGALLIFCSMVMREGIAGAIAAGLRRLRRLQSRPSAQQGI